jgi:hypothetical protein
MMGGGSGGGSGGRQGMMGRGGGPSHNIPPRRSMAGHHDGVRPINPEAQALVQRMLNP